MSDRSGSIGGDPLDEGASSGPARAPLLGPSSHESMGDGQKRDRLMAALALMAGIGLLLALPFALQAGAVFFLPLTTALTQIVLLRSGDQVVAVPAALMESVMGSYVVAAASALRYLQLEALLSSNASSHENEIGPIRG